MATGLQLLPPTAVADEIATRPVIVERVELREPVRTLRFAGVIRSRRRAVLAFPVGGPLIAQRAPAGHRVRQGEILARIDPATLEDDVLAADAERSAATVGWRSLRRELERIDRLVAAGARRPQDLDDARSAEESARARVAAADARLRRAERRLDDAALRAPFDGVVTEVHLELGEYAAPGRPALVLSGDGELEVAFDVPETIVRDLPPGAPVSVSFPMAQHPTLLSQISSVTYANSDPGALFPAVVALPASDALMPGMSAEVAVGSRQALTLLVPVGAVLDPIGGKPFVYRVRDGIAERVAITIVGIAGERVAVEGSLDADDRVVTAGHAALLDGDNVEPTPAAAAKP